EAQTKRQELYRRLVEHSNCKDEKELSELFTRYFNTRVNHHTKEKQLYQATRVRLQVELEIRSKLTSDDTKIITKKLDNQIFSWCQEKFELTNGLTDEELEETEDNEDYQPNNAFIESEKSPEFQEETENVLPDSSDDQESGSIIVSDCNTKGPFQLFISPPSITESQAAELSAEERDYQERKEKIKEGLNREFKERSTLVAQLTTIPEPPLSPKRSRKIKMSTTLEKIQDTENSEEKNKATATPSPWQNNRPPRYPNPDGPFVRTYPPRTNFTTYVPARPYVSRQAPHYNGNINERNIRQENRRPEQNKRTQRTYLAEQQLANSSEEESEETETDGSENKHSNGSKKQVLN
ncbi:7479_t:CDS:2, partial [Ambispora gerdemannii]